MARFASSVLTGGTIPANVNALIATTLPKVQPDIVDNFFDATPFFWWMREKERTMTWDGGESLELPIMFDENPNAKAYSAYEVMDVTPPQGIGTTWWRLAHYRVPVMYSRNSAAANRGEAAVVNMISALKEQAELSLIKRINTDLFSEGTQDSKKINSMYHLVQETTATAQSNVVGGVSKSTYSWWRNQWATITSASSGIVDATRELHMLTTDGSDAPDLGLADAYSYIHLEESLSTNVRFVNPKAVEYGFENMTYKGVTIMMDKTIDDGDQATDGDGSMFFINTKYLKLVLGSDANFRVDPPEYDKWQDAYVGQILVDIQTVVSNCKRQGVLQGGANANAK